MTEPMQNRPRFGVLRRGNGEQRTVVFYPHESRPDSFVAHYADTEEVAVVDKTAGDRIQVDNLAPGQTIYIEYPNEPGPVRGRLQSDRSNDMDSTEIKPKDPNGWWKGLIMLAGLAAIVVLTVAGINWAIGI